ncbi:MAG TPA: hypothetical protein VFO91_00060 [Anaerolineales bacterium]|nr:hypothetical protein [Anaerolineales bacterium]
MAITNSSSSSVAPLRELQLKKLTPEQVTRIDEVFASVGEYGEVHLVVQRGELRYINKVESFKVCGNESKE